MKGPFKIPLGRGKYLIRLTQVVLSNLIAVQNFIHVCVSPNVSNRTYITSAHSLSCIKSLIVENESVKGEYDDESFLNIDFSCTDQLYVSLKANSGDVVEGNGFLIFELLEM